MAGMLVVCPAGHVDATMGDDVIVEQGMHCFRCAQAGAHARFVRVEDEAVLAVFGLAMRGDPLHGPKSSTHVALDAAQELWDFKYRSGR